MPLAIGQGCHSRTTRACATPCTTPWLARPDFAAGVQAEHPPHVRSAARAAYPGPKGMMLPDSCQQAFQDEVNPSAEDAAALAASILIIEATTGVPE